MLNGGERAGPNQALAGPNQEGRSPYGLQPSIYKSKDHVCLVCDKCDPSFFILRSRYLIRKNGNLCHIFSSTDVFKDEQTATFTL